MKLIYLAALALLYLLASAFQVLPLSGGILQQQYVATIFLGTPPSPFSVLIDTGSEKLAVNCQGCSNCQNHPHLPFDPAQSSSASIITCGNNLEICENCNQESSPADKCQYYSQYYDRSWISGTIIDDILSLNAGSSGARSKIGCINNCSNAFATDSTIDGIWGTGRSDQNVNGEWYRSDVALQTLSSQFGVAMTYSLCLAYEGGKMVVGGIDSSSHTQPPVIVSYNGPFQDHISQGLTEVKIGPNIINYNAGAVMHDLIIDSGSSGSLLDAGTVAQVTQTISQVCSSIGESCWLDPDSSSKCVELDNAALLSNFPSISFMFSSKEVFWYPEEYLAIDSTQYPTYFCFGADVPPEGSSYLLGARFMLNKDIVFGSNSIQIYPKSNCGGRNFNQVSSSLTPLQSAAKSKKSEHNAAVFWVIMGPIMVVLVILALLFYCAWRKKYAKDEIQTEREPEIDVDGAIAPPTDERMRQNFQMEAQKA